MTDIPDNRTRILATAEALFAEKGFSATSVREILRGAGVTSPTLYHYFGSKEELLVTLLRERFETFFGRVSEALDGCRTPLDVLQTYAGLAFEGLSDRSTTVRFVFSVLYGARAEVPARELLALRQTYGDTLAEALQRVAPHLAVRKIDFVAALFTGMVNGVLMQYLNGFLERVDEPLAAAIASRAAAMLEDDLPVPELSPSLCRSSRGEESRP